ncbi:GDP-L-fucose synthase [candidate division KSB1 bacterium]|nr:GDP-L-fucose synthase [candidate division KSB1 bacterium]
MDKNTKIYIAGNTGMVGSAIQHNLELKGYTEFVFTPYPEYDLTNQKTVQDFFEKERPEYVIDAAAKVGGILANNTLRAQFIYENLMIQNNLIHNAHISGVKKLLFLGSSCIYPRDCSQPIREEYLLTNELEQTNEPYAIAKIAGIKMCENYYRQYGSNFISVMPTNLYGPRDNFNLKTSHVIPALIRKFHEAKVNHYPEVIVWGTGHIKREFLYVDDLADACVYLLQRLEATELYTSGVTHINIGCGYDQSIQELAMMIGETVGFIGKINFDDSMLEGTPQKLLDISYLKELGWEAKISLEEGLRLSYDWYLENYV